MININEAGMTLVEALVALFIMGLASAMIVLSMPPRPAPIEVAIYKLEDLAKGARQAALVKGAWTGVVAQDGLYRTVSYSNGAWRPSLAKPVTIQGELVFDEARDKDDVTPVFQFGPTGTAIEEKVALILGVNERYLEIARSGDIIVSDTP